MGQDVSSPLDENTPPERLRSRTVDGIAQYIKDGRAKRIVVMTGAGISTSAGIPDFRSPDTGLYANLARLNLPYAEAVFDISYFRTNPQPFYTLARELYPGKYRPTITHSFVNLLHKKGLLLKLFTQNIDCLERQAGVPGDMIVEAHGSFATQRCIECKLEYPEEDMKEMIRTGDVPTCHSCEGLVKPDIVFFGEQLPEEFFKNKFVPSQSDLCIVMGTSLTVHPFAMLPQLVSSGVPRILINLERVGDLGGRTDDVCLLGDCDSGVRKLAEACGWLDELEDLWKATEREEDRVAAAAAAAEVAEPRTREEKLEDEVDKLTKEVEHTLKISKGHADFLNAQLGRKQQEISEKATQGEVATAEPSHPPPQSASKPPSDEAARTKFINSITSHITHELHLISTRQPSTAPFIKSLTSTSPSNHNPDLNRPPDAQWTYLPSSTSTSTSTSTPPNTTTPPPSLILLVGPLTHDESIALDAAALKHFATNPSLRTALLVSPKADQSLDSRRADVKVWERAPAAEGAKAKCVLNREFRSAVGEAVEGVVGIGVEMFGPDGVVEGVEEAVVRIEAGELVGWLRGVEGEREGEREDVWRDVKE